MGRAADQVAKARGSLTEANKVLDDLDKEIGDNGGPTLDGSSPSSTDKP
jgi:hypothetical protein